jgi:hypothetical protein
MNFLTLLTGWIIAGFMGALGAVILYHIVKGNIDLKFLISDSQGQASLSRLQFLIFTFVIAMSFFLVVVGGDTGGSPSFPDKIPPGIFGLLGISGGSYVISKGIKT